MGQMLRQRPGAMVTRPGATGMRRFHISAIPRAGQNISRPTSATPTSSMIACSVSQIGRCFGSTVRLLAGDSGRYFEGDTRTAMLGCRDVSRDRLDELWLNV